MKTFTSLGLLGATLVASPTPTQAEVMNFTFDGKQAGCLTRALKAMDNKAIKVIPDPSRPGQGMILRISKPALHNLIRELATTNRICLAQAQYLLSPEGDKTVDYTLRWSSPADALKSVLGK